MLQTTFSVLSSTFVNLYNGLAIFTKSFTNFLQQLASLKNFCTSLTNLDTSQSDIVFIFFPFIFILSGPIITPKKSTFLTFYLHFSSFVYNLFSSNLLSISSTNLLCPFLLSVPTITLLIKLPTFPGLIKSLSNSFIMAWSVASEFVKPNMTVGLNNPSGVVKATFYLSLSFILTLL